MLNIIKMDLYRMVKTRSLYVVWIIMAVLLFAPTFLIKAESEAAQETQQSYGATDSASNNTNLGMSVEIPTELGDKTTVYDLVYANTQAKYIALFFMIFVVLFSTADIHSGYLKNIGGQVKGRTVLIISKAVCLSIYTVVSMILVVLVQTVAAAAAFGYLKMGPWKEFLAYMGVETVLHIALMLIVMAISIILKNNAVSMVVSICLCMNLATVLYSSLDKIIAKAGVKDFSVIMHTVTGKISLLSMNPTGRDIISALLVAVIFGAVFVGIVSAVFQKRDI